jgi:transcriptional regulator with XRE-family HTH domain
MVKLQELFIRNLRTERKKAGLTQEQAAEKIGITHSFYSAVENGAKFPSIQKIQDIGEALGVAPYRLFLDSPSTSKVPPGELIDRYNQFLEERYRKDLKDAKAQFLESLES